VDVRPSKASVGQKIHTWCGHSPIAFELHLEPRPNRCGLQSSQQRRHLGTRAKSLSLVLVDVGSELPCCPAVWNNAPRNCCRAAVTEVVDGAEALEAESVAAVEVALELVEDVSLDDVNPSCDNAAEIACSCGFVPPPLLVDVVDEESAPFAFCWFARVRCAAHGSALAAEPVSAEMDMHCSE
jgi:hypothetical protein